MDHSSFVTSYNIFQNINNKNYTSKAFLRKIKNEKTGHLSISELPGLNKLTSWWPVFFSVSLVPRCIGMSKASTKYGRLTLPTFFDTQREKQWNFEESNKPLFGGVEILVTFFKSKLLVNCVSPFWPYVCVLWRDVFREVTGSLWVVAWVNICQKEGWRYSDSNPQLLVIRFTGLSKTNMETQKGPLGKGKTVKTSLFMAGPSTIVSSLTIRWVSI